MRARDEFKDKVQVPNHNDSINQAPGDDYSKMVAALPPKYVKAKPGEVICQLCGEPITPDQYTKDPERRKYQVKNHLHDKCDEAKERWLDTSTGVDPDRHRKAAEEEAKRRQDRKLPDRFDKNLKF